MRTARGGTRRAIATLAALVVFADVAGQVPAATAGGGEAHIRVNQVGYATTGPKRAFLLSTQPCEGAAFQVLDDAPAEVFDGVAGADRGPWNATYPHVCALVFDALGDTGDFTITAAGATSPGFQVRTPADLYEPLVANALTFYLGQRDGADVDPSVLDRKPSHLHDRNAKVYAVPDYKGERLQRDLRRVGGPVDVEGGWFDAGDYVKFTGTTSFAVTLMLVAVRDHPSLFAGGGPGFESEAERGVRWLLRMVDVPRRSLYYQVGIGSGGAGILADHDVWRLPQKDDGWTQHARRYLAHRPVLRVAPSGAKVPPSLAGRLASVFGLCAQLWSGTPLATKCLHEGQVVFSMAKTKDVDTQITSSPVGYYREDEWRDDLEMGATQLYLGLSQPGAPAPEPPASTPRYYLKQAARWANSYMGSPLNGGDTFNLYDIAGLAHPELHRAIEADGGGGLKVSPADLLQDMRDQMDPRSKKAGGDPFAFGAYPWDPAPHSFGLISEGLLYDDVSGTTRYANLARSQADWTLGANAWGTSFVVGAGTTFPFCMQHQIANLAGSTDGAAPILAGATVDGPADYIPGAGFFGDAVECPPGGANPFAPFDIDGWRYIDRVQSWSTVEPSLDYTAMSFFAFVQLATA